MRTRLGRLTGEPWRTRYLMLAAGAVGVLAFPAPNWSWLAWFGLVPGLLLIVRSDTAREAGVRAWWLGAGYIMFGLYWLAPEIGPGLLGVGAVFGALCVPFGVSARLLLRPPLTFPRAGAGLVVVPCAWVLTDWLRSWQALGGPWDVYGASQWQHPAILGLAAVGGVWLVSFALVMCNVAIVLVIEARRSWLAAAGVVGAAAAIFAGPVAFALTPPAPVARQATVAMVQPGVISNANLQAHASQTLTGELSKAGMLGGVRPDLIVWGESSIAYDITLPEYRGLLGQIEALSAKDGADILVSQDATPPGKGHEKWSVLVSPAGIRGIYVKTRLVPFGEYIPFRQQLGWLTKFKAASSNMIPGTGAHVLHATDRSGQSLPIGVLVCFESAFPDMSRVDSDLGAQLIVYQSETVTFQGTWGPDQHASLGALRAAETGRPVVQAALTGVTVAFDARGRLLGWMGQSQHGVLTTRLRLPPASYRTIYDRYGDYVPWVAIAVVVIAALVMFVRFLARNTGESGGRGAQYEAGVGQPETRTQGKANLV
jgi:apolipoprotein N-acyltransferase